MAKMNNVNVALEIARRARTILGANGILDEYPVMRHMANLESVYTYEGAHDLQVLMVGQAGDRHPRLPLTGPAAAPGLRGLGIQVVEQVGGQVEQGGQARGVQVAGGPGGGGHAPSPVGRRVRRPFTSRTTRAGPAAARITVPARRVKLTT